MNFPGKNRLRHWFWVISFRYPGFRRTLTRLLVPEGEVDIELFGAKLRIDRREEIGLWRAARAADEIVIFRDEVASLLSLALLIQPGDTFVDVGANVGLYSSLLGRACHVFSTNQCYAIEANPATASRLRQSLAGQPVQILNIAVSNQAGELNFEPGVTSGVFHATSERSPDSRQVPCARLDQLIPADKDVVMKIDVEGHEWPALQGAQALFDAGRVKVVYLDGYNGKQIPEFLISAGFSLFEGRTMAACDTGAPDYSLLAVHYSRLGLVK
jgi:FkbM family methyltransferase